MQSIYRVLVRWLVRRILRLVGLRRCWRASLEVGSAWCVDLRRSCQQPLPYQRKCSNLKLNLIIYINSEALFPKLWVKLSHCIRIMKMRVTLSIDTIKLINNKTIRMNISSFEIIFALFYCIIDQISKCWQGISVNA